MSIEASDLSGFVERLEELPTLPAVAIRLIELTTDNGTGLREVVRMIENDHAISAKVLKIANSAYYSRQGKVSSVERAAVLLGKDMVRSVVLTAVVFDCFRPSSSTSFDLVKFWSHCAACAIAAEVIATRLKYPRPMDAFMAGLLHDMGKLVLACWNAQEYGQAVAQARQSRSRLLEIEEERFGIGHTALAKLTMEKWRFPPDLIESAWLHHQPLSYFGDDPRNQLPFLVKAANSLCHIYRIGDSGDPGERWTQERLSMATGLSAEELNEVSAQVLSRFEQVSKSFDWEANTVDLYLSAVNRANQELSQIQLRLSADARRLELRDQVLSAFEHLNQALDGPVSSAQGLIDVLRLMGNLLPHRKMILYVVQKHPHGLQGSLKRSQDAPPERFFLTLSPSSAQRFETLTTRAQVSFLHETLRRQDSPIQGGAEFAALFQDPHLLVFPLASQRGLIGQLLVEVEAEVQDRKALLDAARSFTRGAALALDRLLLIEDLHHQAELLAQTGRKVEEAERKLFHSERLASVGRLAAGAAHEINNPLTVISGHTELLLHSTQDEKQGQRLNEIARQIERISEITANLMGLARPAEPQVEPVELKPLLESTIHLLRQRIRVASIEVRKEINHVPVILADPKQLEQVFLNLAINAVQAMPSGGTLSVRLGLDKDGKEAQIDIQDSGKGIRPEDLPSIFDPFFTTKEEGEGTGLGLAICLSIVRNHGGRILVSSRAGKGSVFRILLPLNKPDNAHRPSKESEQSNESNGSSRHQLSANVLVVDDEQPIRDMLRSALTESGLDLEFAEDGLAAIKQLDGRRFDAVLLDLRMPKKAGIDVLRVLRETRPRMPVIIVSGVAHENEFEAARQAGAFACIRKPFKMDNLIDILNQALQTSVN